MIDFVIGLIVTLICVFGAGSVGCLVFFSLRHFMRRP
jgi:hypothetical protein